MNEKSFCTECGEPNYQGEPNCEYCGGIVRMVGGGKFPANVTAPTRLKAPPNVEIRTTSEEPTELLTGNINALLQEQRHTNVILTSMASFFLYSIHGTLIFLFLVISAIKKDSTGGLWVTWLMYFGLMGGLVLKARKEIDV